MRVRKTFTVNLVDNPNWIPSPGTSTVISTNAIEDVLSPSSPTTTTGSGQQHWHIFAQAGTLYNPYNGPHGSLMMWGSGHFGRKGNGVYGFEIKEDGTWVNLTRDYPQDIYQTVGSGNNGWYDLSGYFAGRYTQGPDATTRGSDLGNNNYGDYLTTPWDLNSTNWYGASPATSHTRGDIVFVPGGTNNKGQMVLPFVHGNYAGQGFRYAHIFDCGRESWDALTYDQTKIWWKRGGRLPIPTTDGTVPNGLTTAGMYQGVCAWHEPDRSRIGIIGTVFESVSARTIFYLDTNTWQYSVGPRTAAGVFMYMNPDANSGYVPGRRLLVHVMPPNATNGGASPGGTGCLQFQMIDLSNTAATFFSPVKMNFSNAAAGPQMPYTDMSLPLAGQPDRITGVRLEYCPYDGAFWFAWTSRHLPEYNTGYQWGDTTIWRLKPKNRDLRGTDSNTLIMADQWEWTDMTSLITPRLDSGLVRFMIDQNAEKVTAVATNGTLTCRNFFSEEQPIRFVNPPPGVSKNTVYYAKNVTPAVGTPKTSLQVSSIPGGAAITYASASTPTDMYIYADSNKNLIGVFDFMYGGLHWVNSLNCFAFFRGSHSVTSPFYGSVQLFKPPGF